MARWTASACAYHSNSLSMRAAALSIHASFILPSSEMLLWIVGIDSTDGALDRERLRIPFEFIEHARGGFVDPRLVHLAVFRNAAVDRRNRQHRGHAGPRAPAHTIRIH